MRAINPLSSVTKSRMMGDLHVRFCERLEVKLLRPTRRVSTTNSYSLNMKKKTIVLPYMGCYRCESVYSPLLTTSRGCPAGGVVLDVNHGCPEKLFNLSDFSDQAWAGESFF